MSAVNPKIIKWARERTGYSVEELAVNLKRSVDDVEAWEAGVKSPTYAQLEKLAYKEFKLPLAVFFFPEPPDIEDPKAKYRRLPDYELNKLSPDTLYIIRQTLAYQDSLAELFFPNFPKKQIHKKFSFGKSKETNLAKKIRKYLGISISEQFRFRSCEEAFKFWRGLLEDHGVFTFKNSFKDRFVSGFCLFHENFPVIAINNSNSFSRQLFTLAHELGHVLMNVNGITDVDESYISYMSKKDRDIEVKCNAFASELLLPEEHFHNEIELIKSHGEEAIEDVARKYSVSREVILRRCMDLGLVAQDFYLKKSSDWNKDYLRVKSGSKGGSYYLTKIAYLGESFTKLAFDNYHSGRINKVGLATHLNMNACNIEKLEQRLGW